MLKIMLERHSKKARLRIISSLFAMVETDINNTKVFTKLNKKNLINKTSVYIRWNKRFGVVTE